MSLLPKNVLPVRIVEDLCMFTNLHLTYLAFSSEILSLDSGLFNLLKGLGGLLLVMDSVAPLVFEII